MSDPWCDVTVNPRGEIIFAESLDGAVRVTNKTTGAVWQQNVPTDFLRFLRIAATEDTECAIGVGADDMAYVVQREYAVPYVKVSGQDAVAIVALPDGTFVPYAVVDPDTYVRGYQPLPMPHSSQGLREVFADGAVHFGDDYVRPEWFAGRQIWRRTEKLGWVIGQRQDGSAAYEVATGRYFTVVRGLRTVEGVHFTVTPAGVLVICAATDRGVFYRAYAPPYPAHEPIAPDPPPPPPQPIGPRSDPRAADGRVYDLLTYILGDQATWPRNRPSHPMNQVLASGGRVHFVKFGDPQAYETWGADAHWIYHLEDASADVYAFADIRWYPRHMPIGYASAFDTGEHQNTYRVRATCQVLTQQPSRRRMWVEALYDRFYWGPDLGERETLVTVYDPTAGIHASDRFVELYYFAKGAGWVRWDAYRSDQVYAHGAPSFAGLTPQSRSDFYLLGGPNTQPKLSGCVPAVITAWPPLEPTDPPDPHEPPEATMLTVAIKGPGGKYGRADAAGTGPWGSIGWRGVVWDGDEPSEDYQFELTQPDDRFKLVHVRTRGLFGVDATKYSGNIGQQFYLKPDENDRGGYESPVVYEGNLAGFLEGVVEYVDGKYPSCAFAVEVLP